MTPEEIAAKTLELLGENGEHWAKHTLARDERGISCGALSPAAVCWCLAGAAMKLTMRAGHDGFQERSDFYHAVTEAAQTEHRFVGAISTFNDAEETTFDVVATALRKVANNDKQDDSGRTG